MNALTVSGLVKRYPGFLLKEVSFEVPQGAVVGFIGRNGAGKSTTIRCLLGLAHAEGGEVLYRGKNIKEDEKYFKEHIGVVIGGEVFYPKKKLGTIARVTAGFYPGWDEEKYRYYLDLFGLDETKRMDELSTGMQVKFRIALALSHGADLFIMDEPTSGLDPVSREELTDLFRAMVKDGTRSILFSTHITSDLQKCASDIVFIRDGAITFSGKTEDFLTRFADKGHDLEEIIVAMERRPLDESIIL